MCKKLSRTGFTILFFPAFFISAFTALAQGQLSWSTRQIDFHPTIEQSSVQADFEFANVGNSVVNIRDVKTSCGCTTAAMDKRSYDPGEKGKISVVFNIGERIGFQQKQIMVTTDSLEEPTAQLTIRAFIPELIRMEPRAVIWPVNSEAAPRVIHLTTGTEQPIKVLGVRASDDRLFAKLKSIRAGRSYDIELTVSATAEPLRGSVRIDTDYPPSHPRVYTLPVEIQPPFIGQVAPFPGPPPSGQGAIVPPPPPGFQRTPAISATSTAPTTSAKPNFPPKIPVGPDTAK